MGYAFKREVKGEIKVLQENRAKRCCAFATVEGIIHGPSLKTGKLEIEIDSILEAKGITPSWASLP
jgi:hypothetical protein